MRWIDLHCDTLTACEEQGLSMRSNARTQLDFTRLKKAGAGVQCFAVFLDREALFKRGVSAWRRYEQLRDHFFEEIKNNRDAVRHLRTAEEFAEAERDGAVGAVLTVEGGELLSGALSGGDGCAGEKDRDGVQRGCTDAGGAKEDGEEFLEKSAGGGEIDILRARLTRMWADGVRLLTLTWNHENGLGYPNGSACGLKEAGYEAVAYMQELGMLVDVSHLSDRGFWDVIEAAKKPVIASHSCARSLCGHQRNLTDAQLRALGENGGVAGVNFHAPFLKEQGTSGSVPDVACHLRHMISCAGSEAVAFGSDYDGMQGAPEWGGCEGMPRLIEALSAYFDANTLEKICFRNAERLIGDSFGNALL